MLRIGKMRLLLAAALLVIVAAPAFAQPAPAAKPAAVPAPKDAAALQAIENQVKAVVAKVLPSVVGIRIGNSQGSGVIVTKDGWVATAGHLIPKPDEDVTFLFADGKTVKGKTRGLDKTTDSGLMKITQPGEGPAGEWPAVEKGTSAAVPPGAWCVGVGHPLGYQQGRPPVVRVGRVLSVGDNAIRSDCLIVAGDSGGPLFDLDGKWIGIHSRIGGSANLNMHVPVDVYKRDWDDLAAGRTLNAEFAGKDAAEVKSPFRPVVRGAAQCVCRVKCDGREAILGTIVGPNGWILTKASELKGKIVCRLRDNREFDAKVVGMCKHCDLAMLKIDAENLPAIAWSQDKPAVGCWVATPGLTDDPIAVGVISVPQRRIGPPNGVLGILLNDDPKGAKIMQVLEGGPAAKAGLKVNDVVTQLNGQAVPNRTVLSDLIKKSRIGETVKLKIRREDKDIEIETKLGTVETSGTRKREMQNQSTGSLSARRDDFQAVLQHDTILTPADCGGPLVDLSGKVIGINIARAGRTETYAAPSDLVVGHLYELMSGRLAPPPPEQKPEPAKKPEPEKKPGTEKEKASPEKKPPSK